MKASSSLLPPPGRSATTNPELPTSRRRCASRSNIMTTTSCSASRPEMACDLSESSITTTQNAPAVARTSATWKKKSRRAVSTRCSLIQLRLGGDHLNSSPGGKPVATQSASSCLSAARADSAGTATAPTATSGPTPGRVGEDCFESSTKTRCTYQRLPHENQARDPGIAMLSPGSDRMLLRRSRMV